MKQNKANVILIKYTLLTFISWLVVSFLIAFLTIYKADEQLHFIVFAGICIFAGFIWSYISAVIYKKIIEPCILHDVDADLYRSILYKARYMACLIPGYSYFFRTAEYNVGNYQTVINVCVNKLSRKRYTKDKCTYLCELAHIYYNLADEENLKRICDKYKEYLAREKKQDRYIFLSGRIQFYTDYLNGDFEKCNMYLQETNEPQSQYRDVRSLFFRAMICYKSGNSEEAKNHFEKVIQLAPKLYFSNLAQRYIEQIELGKEYTSVASNLLPQASLDSPSSKRLPRITTILSHVLMFLLSYTVVYLTANAIYTVRYNQYKDYAEERLEDFYGYENVDVSEIFYLERDGETLECICVFESSDEGIVIGCIYYRNGEDELFFSPKITNPEIGSYVIEGEVVWGNIGCYFYENENDVHIDFDHTTKITVDGTPLYFSLVYWAPN